MCEAGTRSSACTKLPPPVEYSVRSQCPSRVAMAVTGLPLIFSSGSSSRVGLSLRDARSSCWRSYPLRRQWTRKTRRPSGESASTSFIPRSTCRAPATSSTVACFRYDISATWRPSAESPATVQRPGIDRPRWSLPVRASNRATVVLLAFARAETNALPLAERMPRGSEYRRAPADEIEGLQWALLAPGPDEEDARARQSRRRRPA